MAVQVLSVVPGEVERYRPGIVEVYRRVFTAHPWSEPAEWADGFGDGLVEWRRFTPGFRLVVALDDDRVAGFAMGATWDPENWFCGPITQLLDPIWTRSCFHLMELALLPEHRGRKIGGLMHDEILDDLDADTALLSTNRLGPPPAASLYINRGWQLLLRDWRHCEECDPVHVMGAVLRPIG
ncbi:MAG TPA: GNAT family N-acetyltransferase [Actinomycetota bacterium]|nr:GNAT family N-acetyltransferase [Actinomycetota bacterium]